jgi:hypothetical protein
MHPNQEMPMRITIEIPPKDDILGSGFEVRVSQQGEGWEKSQLEDYADRRGVYILHSNGRILYVGQTTKGPPYGIFGERLRREFHEKAAGEGNRLHKLLASQERQVFAYLLDLEDIDMMIDAGSVTLSRESKALIMEQVLIGIYEPEGNQK